jgi:hypothetical protein
MTIALQAVLDVRKQLQQTGGTISLRSSSAISLDPIAPMPQGMSSLAPATSTPIAPPAGTPSVPSRPNPAVIGLPSTGGLVNGVVTLRVSLVDASPITLR